MENEREMGENTREILMISELTGILSEKISSSDVSKNLANHQLVVDFSDRLMAKYGRDEVLKRKLFHVLASSGDITHEKSPYFDFDGDDSIEKFIREL